MLNLKIKNFNIEIIEEESSSVTEENNKIIKNFSIKSYKKFIEILREYRSKKVDSFFKIIKRKIEDKYYILLMKESDIKSGKLILSYEVESKEIEELFDKIFFNREDNRRHNINKNNFYNLFMVIEVLEFFLINADLESRKEEKYKKMIKKKKSGKVRILYAPHSEIIKSLQKINIILQKTYDKRNINFQVAYKKGKSIYDNAVMHRNLPYIMKADLKDFFPSCKRELVEKYIEFLFKNSINGKVCKKLFLDEILIEDGLFIGSPISGTLANAILSTPIAYMKNICKNFDMEFSIYADDMTFSSDRFITVDFVKSIFECAFTTYGLDEYFKLNEEKFVGYSGTNRRSVGLSINPENKITINNRKYKILRAALHNIRYPEGKQPLNANKIRGLISFASAYDENGKIFRLLKKYEKEVREFNLASDKVFNKLENRFSKEGQ